VKSADIRAALARGESLARRPAVGDRGVYPLYALREIKPGQWVHGERCRIKPQQIVTEADARRWGDLRPVPGIVGQDGIASVSAPRATEREARAEELRSRLLAYTRGFGVTVTERGAIRLTPSATELVLARLEAQEGPS
jgi:hypothetical protein